MKVKHLYKASFNCDVSCLHLKEKDRFLAQASLENIKDHLPKDIDFEKNEDIIAFAANGTTVNRGNRNGHLIDAKTVAKVHDLFKYKYLDLEHNRDFVVGVITNTGFSSYDKNTIIPSDEVEDLVDPFYLTVGGIVYRAVNQDFAEKLEESSDPQSKNYRKISLSWEIAFSSYYLLIGKKNLAEGTVIKDPEKIKEYAKYLSFNGGNNELEDGTPIYTVAAGDDVLPMGFGFTLSPAADVAGVLLQTEVAQNDEEEGVEVKANKINISLSEQTNVKARKPPYTQMEIKNLEEFYQNWNEVRASDKAPKLNFIVTQLEKAGEDYAKKVKAKQEEIDNSVTEKAVLDKTIADLGKTVAEQKASLETLEKENKEKEIQTKYQERMNVIDEEYTLDKDARAIVASEIKGKTDEEFAAWKKTFDVFASEKTKVAIAAKKQEKTDLEEKNKTQKEKIEGKKDEKEVITEVLANTTEKEGQEITNSSEATDSLKQKFEEALKDGFEIVK